MPRSGWLSACCLALCAAPASAQSLWVYTHGNAVRVGADDGRAALSVAPVVWGPNWGWTGIGGAYATDDGGGAGQFTGRVGLSKAPFTFTSRLRPGAADGSLRMDGEFRVAEDADVMLAVFAVSFGPLVTGEGRGRIVDDQGERVVNLPLGQGSLSKGLKRLEARDAAGRVFAVVCDPPLPAAMDRDARLVVAQGKLPAGAAKPFSVTLEWPAGDARLALGPAAVPVPADWDRWFAWTADGDAAQPSVIDASALLDAPAGRHGRVTRRDDALLLNGAPVKFWGVNLCYAATAPDRARAGKRAAFYAKYGVNAVRFHKFADGAGWAGILSRDSYVRFDPQALDRMDYQVAQFKERGIYTLLSANFGRARLYRDDMARVPYAAELGKPNEHGVLDPGNGALFLSTELQDIQIEQLVNVLRHKNPHTGLAYAEDPAVMAVELVNEDDIFFYGTSAALGKSKTLRDRAGAEFAAWLKARYATEAAWRAAWGPNALNIPDQKAVDEAFNDGKGPIYPVGNPWFYDPDQLAGSQAHRKQRFLDTLRFLYEKQNAFHDRFVAALRDAGYDGEVVASNWFAGRGAANYLNLASDRRTGMIDRHNYFEGAGSMLARPGSGILSIGLMQAADRPFMLSEWIHTFPGEFGAEGPALIGAYGMGLQGWDASFMFQNGDEGGFRKQLGDQWDVVAPQILGLFPAVARQALRGDVRESDVRYVRRVTMDGLARGEYGEPERVAQAGDVKELASDAIPPEALAVGRAVVAFDGDPAAPDAVYAPGAEPFVASSTGELRWTPADGGAARGGYVAVDTPRTQAVVGFAEGIGVKLRDVTIRVDHPFAAVYVTSLDDAPIATAKRVLVTALARVRNTGQKMVAGALIEKGAAPMRLEPVAATLRFARADAPAVRVLDHDGRATERAVAPAADGAIRLDAAQTRTIYYEITFR